MFRHLERAENTSRLVDAGMRIALTRSSEAEHEWESVVTTAGLRDAYVAGHGRFDAASVIDFLLRDESNPSSVGESLNSARTNARSARTAITREVWEATNSAWMAVRSGLAKPVSTRDLPTVLGLIRHETAIVRGALVGTMLRNDAYNFARLGTLLERADSTARILDVKYYVLLPSVSAVGGTLDSAQWETILRSVASQRAFRWKNGGEITPRDIARFLILDVQSPRSLAFCFGKIDANLGHLAAQYGQHHPCHTLAREMSADLAQRTIGTIFDEGLHEFLSRTIHTGARLGAAIEDDYRFWR
jgi:uncharacterized alpha-E superfamily protein